jgi:hypothetical protein
MVQNDQQTLKPPYLEKLGEQDGLVIWRVDGAYIRSKLDVEFTNFGQHYRYPYIPLDEFWIDGEAANDERRFFIEHLLVEYEMMREGASYAVAQEAAGRAERRERRRTGDLHRLTRNGQQLPNGSDVHERLWKKLENGVSVWIVNGRLVRSVFDIDFTAGGHDCVYEYVPRDEVWIDNDIGESERAYVLLHEMHERNRMAAGMPYSRAHEESSRLEFHCRRHPDELHDALEAEGWA